MEQHRYGLGFAALVTGTIVVAACAFESADDSLADRRPVMAAAQTEIAERIASYIEVLTNQRDAELARDYYTEDARLLGPGIDLDRSAIIDGIRSVLDAGSRVQVSRQSLELFVHGDAAYEIAQAEDTILSADGATTDTMRNNLFIRWERGTDGRWRFDRVLLGPRTASSGQ